MVQRKVKRRRYPFNPDYATPPSATLMGTMDALGIGPHELAKRTGFSYKHITQVIQGDKRLTPHTATRLELATGVPARLWNNLELQFQERCQKLKFNESEVRRQAYDERCRFDEVVS